MATMATDTHPSTANPKAAVSPNAPESMLTRIVATVGPASGTPEAIERLIEAGVSVFRFNFSHGSLEDHVERLRTIRAVAERHGVSTAVLGDLQGPKIRVGKVADGGIELATGTLVEFRRGDFTAAPPAPGDRAVFGSTYERLVSDVNPGQRLLVNDGAVRMLVVERTDDAITCTVTHGGLVTSGKGINLPDSALTVDTITERDWTHVAWAIEHGLDFLALSFVRSAADIEALRRGIADRAGSDLCMPIVAKIEVPQAVDRMDEILDAADAIMVARGDLGVELDLAQVPIVQKRLIAAARAHGKPCIVATQMLESMIESPSPTRAEANDVACAIIDGADAVMLSGETAVGRYPVLAVEQMRRIAIHTESYLADQPAVDAPPTRLRESGYRTAALAHGVRTVADDLDAVGIVVWSESGGGARYLSRQGFRVPIYAVSSDERACRQMQLYRGVTTVCIEPPSSVDLFVTLLDQHLQDVGRARAGDRLVFVYGEPLGEPRVTDSILIHLVGACWMR